MSDEPTAEPEKPIPDPPAEPLAPEPPAAEGTPPAADTAPAQPTTPEPAPDMEAHHHAHHHGPKTWRSYLFEFFMLFLAVFCGFLAEWQLEHVVEHQREETFMRSMMEDLDADIAQSAGLASGMNESLARLDSLLDLLLDTTIIHDSRLGARLWRRSQGFVDFVYTDGTVQQLKYSGAMRLIRQSDVADSIMAYDRNVRTLQIHQDLLNSTVMDRFHMRFFDMRALKLHPDGPVPLQRSTAQDLSEAYADRSHWRRQLTTQQEFLAEVGAHAARLRSFIIAQYGLGD